MSKSEIADLVPWVKERNPTMKNDNLIVGYCDHYGSSAIAFSMDNGQLTMDNYQLFIINYQLSIIN
jgi:hypothetical protein